MEIKDGDFCAAEEEKVRFRAVDTVGESVGFSFTDEDIVSVFNVLKMSSVCALARE